jgi:H+/Cl- antiporter ClcA
MMWTLVLILWLPTLAVFVVVLFVNFHIPIRGRLDHALAAAIISALVWGAWDLVTGTKGFLFIEAAAGQAAAGLILVFIADLIGTFISFSNRLRNAIVTAIVFAAVYLGLMYYLILVAGVTRGAH